MPMDIHLSPTPFHTLYTGINGLFCKVFPTNLFNWIIKYKPIDLVPNVLPSLSDAEDPDLDSLLADLCQLEEDTKTQLANATNALESEKPNAQPPPRYVSELCIGIYHISSIRHRGYYFFFLLLKLAVITRGWQRNFHSMITICLLCHA